MASSSSSGKNRNAANKGVVVWEWFNEHGKWRPYAPEVSTYIDKEGQNVQQVCLANVSAALKMYTVDIPSMCQIRKGTGTSRPVRRVIYPAGSPAAQQVVWEYEGDVAGQWVTYDLEISACLENAQQTGQQMLDMSALFNLPYSVHFTTMQQVRINTGRARKIRRSPLKTPYPTAAKSPKCLNKITTILPPSSSVSQSQSQPQPSTSGHNRVFWSTSGGSSVPGSGGSNSGGQLKRGRSAATVPSSSDSDSDSDTGMTLRLRTRQYKRLKKSHAGGGGGSSSGKKSSKGADGSGASGSASGSGAGMMTPQQAAGPHNQHRAARGVSHLPPSSSFPPIPAVSLASAGSTVPLNLITYAQPLGANLTKGFPPMTHIPPSQLPPLSAPQHPSLHPQPPAQAHSNAPPPSHANSSTSSNGQGHSLGTRRSHTLSSSHSASSSQAAGPASFFGPPHSHPSSLSSSSTPSSMGTYSLLTPLGQQSSGQTWTMSAASLQQQVASGMGMALLPSQNLLHTTPQALPQAAGGSGSYQGPLTRKRVQKQMGAVVGGGSRIAPLNAPHPLMAGLPRGFHPSQPQGMAPTPAAVPLTPLHTPHPLHLHQSLSLPPAATQPLVSHPQHLQPMAQAHFHPQQQQAAMGGGFGLAPAGYPFNQSSFAPTLGHNILPASALMMPGASTGQHGPPPPSATATGPGGCSLRMSNSGGTSSSDDTESLPTETKIILPKKKKAKSKPKTGEEVLARYMELVSPPENEDCCICYETLCGPSSYGEGKAGSCDVIQLNKCCHMFHRLCLLAMYDSSHKGDSLQCPTCKTIYGELLGNCPPGDMTWDILHRPLPGHPFCKTIRVNYYISPGVQGPEHPTPGRRFTARGFPRSGFLPDDNRGRKILKLLMLAFQRKLMFTIGTSATTGETDTVTWNEIHHKTEFGSNLSGHGYPDPNYLDNVTAELALKGVTHQDL